MEVIGSLIDLDCSEDFIKTLLQNVGWPEAENQVSQHNFWETPGAFIRSLKADKTAFACLVARNVAKWTSVYPGSAFSILP